MQAKKDKRILRRMRIRSKLHGTSQRPRASIFRSLNHIYVQFVDDESGNTIVSHSDTTLKGKMTKKDRAFQVGKEAGEKLKEKGISAVVFDRGGFTYHGRVRKVAEGLRESGVKL